jgi:hypothetical protein
LFLIVRPQFLVYLPSFSLAGKDKDEMPLAGSEAKSQASQDGEKPSLLSKIKTALFG